MHRYLITGTDTDVGKTRVTAALALALKRAGLKPTIVKLVQTGLPAGVPGDAARAGKLAGVPFVEFARFEKPADPWSAALAYDLPEVCASDLLRAMVPIGPVLVAEGAGGLMVPLNAREHFGHVAALGNLETIVVVGLRLGCLNHALLTLMQSQQMGLTIAGVVLVERFGPTEEQYRNDIVRALNGKVKILGILPFDENERSSVDEGAHLFEALTARQRKS
jgi:dethiobiotin synthetase